MKAETETLSRKAVPQKHNAVKGIPTERGSEAIRDDRPLIAAIQLPNVEG